MLNPQQFRTPNAAAIFQLLAAASVPAYSPKGELRDGMITAAPLTTENASLFTQAHFIEAETTYAIGWRDPAGYDTLSDFIAPAMTPAGELYQHIEYPNAEAFLSETNADDDLRAINAEFKTVEYTETKDLRSIPNRGLRLVVDYDRYKTNPNWQRLSVDRLMSRLMRNAARRKTALALAAGVAVAKTWDSNSDPDLDIVTEAKNSGDVTGISPNRALWGLAAKLSRFSAYGATNTAKAMAGRNMSPEEACQKFGLQALVDESRYQSGTAKVPIVGSKVLLFSAYGVSGEDPSNFKTARGTTSQGGRFAVYVRQISVKFWEVVVETYETEFCASTLGVRTITVS
jgi:hypothetical protein